MMFDLKNEPPKHIIRLREENPHGQDRNLTDIIRCGEGGYIWAADYEETDFFKQVKGLPWSMTADIAQGLLYVVEES